MNKEKVKIEPKENIVIEDSDEYITCRITGAKKKQISYMYLKSLGWTTTEYKQTFPGAPMQSKSMIKRATKNGGLHMKQEKYRKMFSNMFKGENNPMHKSRTTEEFRKSNTPFSLEFYKKRYPNKSVEELEEIRSKFVKNALKDRISDTTLKYYIQKGYSEEEAKQKLKERQTTFTKEKCIAKYGEEEGLKRWSQRQQKWKMKVFNKNQYIGQGLSKLSTEIIDKIIQYNYNNDILLYGKNEKFIYDTNKSRAYKYDFVNKTNKRIIEINGTYWHCKPTLYDKMYYHTVKKQYAYEIWEYNKVKIDLAKYYNYKVLIIWEDDYYNNSEEVIEKCIDFIYGKDNN